MSSGVTFVIGQMYVAHAILHLLDYPPQQRDGDVKALPPEAVHGSLDIISTMLYVPASGDTVCHHTPHEAGKFSCYCCFCNVTTFPLAENHFVIAPS